ASFANGLDDTLVGGVKRWRGRWLEWPDVNLLGADRRDDNINHAPKYARAVHVNSVRPFLLDYWAAPAVFSILIYGHTSCGTAGPQPAHQRVAACRTGGCHPCARPRRGPHCIYRHW